MLTSSRIVRAPTSVYLPSLLSRTDAVGSIIGTTESVFPAIGASANLVNLWLPGKCALVIKMLDDNIMTLQ